MDAGVGAALAVDPIPDSGMRVAASPTIVAPVALSVHFIPIFM
jgi:hypothetical protein